jgi:hypothetical protein
VFVYVSPHEQNVFSPVTRPSGGYKPLSQRSGASLFVVWRSSDPCFATRLVPDSDVDVLVEFAPTEKTFDRFMALADLLEDTLEHRVEIITRVTLAFYWAAHLS